MLRVGGGQHGIDVHIDQVETEFGVMMLPRSHDHPHDSAKDNLLGNDVVEPLRELDLDGNEDLSMIRGLQQRVVADVGGELLRELVDVRIPTPNLLEECDIVPIQKLGDKLSATTYDPHIPVTTKERSDIPRPNAETSSGPPGRRGQRRSRRRGRRRGRRRATITPGGRNLIDRALLAVLGPTLHRLTG